MKNIVEIVINSLKPDMKDWLQELEIGDYWDSYNNELEWLSTLSEKPQDLVKSINRTMSFYASNTDIHHAATDVALTLESLAPEQYAGKFVYN